MELVFATHNLNKFREVALLMPEHIQLLHLADIQCNKAIPETGATLAENAMLKAQYVADRYHYPCFSDDTGLEVIALNNAPGVHTARYAGIHKNTEDNIQKLLRELHHNQNRTARFKTVIALITPSEKRCFEGIVNGIITHEKRGDKGFGYDPVFQPEGYTQTFAELPLSVKNQISHRAKAVKQFIDYLKNNMRY